MIKDSGDHEQVSTGASRSSSKGRGTPSLLPFDALMELAKHFEEGATIYESRNWEKGLPLSRYLDSMFRHMADIMAGKTDESHERAMAWNAVCFLATWIRINEGTLPLELDDLPHRIASGDLSGVWGTSTNSVETDDLDTNVRDWIAALIKNGDTGYQYDAFCDLVERVVKEKPLARDSNTNAETDGPRPDPKRTRMRAILEREAWLAKSNLHAAVRTILDDPNVSASYKDMIRAVAVK